MLRRSNDRARECGASGLLFRALVLFLSLSAAGYAQTDPGVRGGAAGAGGPIAGLTTAEGVFFASGQASFNEVDSVSSGLGPRFNADSCGACHAHPAVGGSSPFTNPQVALATKNGGTNSIPPFITANGPVREARFIRQPNGSPDGGVHDLFVVAGRADAVGCNIQQPNFAAAIANKNIIFRIPTPTFGTGLIEAIPESTILANKTANPFIKAALGISGHENRSGNDGSITRFGWKAQNKSLELFTGEAYNVEQGVTNEIFQNERDETPGCLFNGTPEDHTNFDQAGAAIVSDVVKFQNFMRFLAPPTPIPDTPSIAHGRQLFGQVGCALCHTPTLRTGKSSSGALSNQNANLYSDLLVHNMGSGLADGIAQGNAAGNEFRTATLWGVGQRIFFLHDGRTTDLLVAIDDHASSGSEANAVISRFDRLAGSDKQDILNFLRAL